MTAGPTDRTNQQKPSMPAFVQAQPEIAIEFKPGDMVGGAYQIMDLLGQGGMGNIYRARHTIMLEEYALKTLRADKLTDVSWKRFQKEAQAIGRMNHQNIVAIYNFGLHEGKVPYYVMAQLQGKTLEKLVAEKGPLPVEEALPIFIEVCNGMGYAHKKGVIHRDVKPPNIVVLDEPQGGSRVKIVDFGIVKLSEDAGDSQQLTNIGEVCGSPYYMSPEQCEAGTLDARSDIYSLGCTIYEVLTGAPPFRGRNVVETMLKHQSTPPATLQAATGGKSFPPMLEQIVARMLAKAPAARYQTMEEASHDLQTIMAGQNQRSLRDPAVTSTTSATSAPAVAQQFAPPVPAPTPLKPPSPAQTSGQYPGRAPAQSLSHPAPRAVPRRNQELVDEDNEEPQFQTSLPPHFMKLMIGVFVVTMITLISLGYWWIQAKPPVSPRAFKEPSHALQIATFSEGAGWLNIRS